MPEADTLNRIADRLDQVGLVIPRRCAADLRKLAQSLQPPVWSGAAPTVEGWYWWREEPGPSADVVCVSKANGEVDLWVFSDSEVPRRLADMSGQWCGPIPKPT